MTAKDHAKLIKRLEAHLLSIKAMKTPDRSYAFTLDTPLGELGITINDTHYSPLVTIFCRFEKAALAAKRFPNEVSQPSGKWNQHFGKGCTVDSVFACFTNDLARTMDAKSIALSVAQWERAA